MFSKHKMVKVRVSQRILWIGSQAYPLQNIARAGELELTYKRGPLIWDYVKAVAAMLALIAVSSVVLSLITPSHTIPNLVVGGALAVIVVRTIRLISNLRLTLYALVIETAGTSRRALVSKDSDLVHDLVVRITDAVNDPTVTFEMNVENFHAGDNINQYGDDNVGKVTA